MWHVFGPGDEITGFEDRRDWLLRNGIAVDSDALPAETDTPAEAEEPEVAEEPEPETPAKPAESTQIKRPAKTAKVDAWRDYIRALGHNPGKKSKEELMEMAKAL